MGWYIVGFCVSNNPLCWGVYEVYMVRYIVGFCVVLTIYVGGREVGCPTV